MLKKAIISGILFSSILLVGCNEEEVIDITESGESEEILSPESIFLSELKNEISLAIKEQTAIEADSMMIEGNFENLSVFVGFLKDAKVDDTMILQIVEDSIKKVSETENVTISEENITIKIEKY
ncbi:MAG: topoisomerase [Solibacillus sp.]